MKQFVVTSEKFSGDILYKFNAEGNITCIDILAEITDEERRWLLEHIPPSIPSLENMVSKAKTLKLAEVPLDLSFDAFWNAYDYKVGKKEAEAAWKKISMPNKVKALQAITAYDKFWKYKKIGKAYPSTYLNDERFNDDFRI